MDISHVTCMKNEGGRVLMRDGKTLLCNYGRVIERKLSSITCITKFNLDLR